MRNRNTTDSDRIGWSILGNIGAACYGRKPTEDCLHSSDNASKDCAEIIENVNGGATAGADALKGTITAGGEVGKKTLNILVPSLFILIGIGLSYSGQFILKDSAENNNDVSCWLNWAASFGCRGLGVVTIAGGGVKLLNELFDTCLAGRK